MLEAATTPRVGRKMEYPDRITLPLAHGVLARIDAALGEDEPRLDLIRVAIERELKRRGVKETPPSHPGSKTSRSAE
jgi:hypothetical protein